MDAWGLGVRRDLFPGPSRDRAVSVGGECALLSSYLCFFDLSDDRLTCADGNAKKSNLSNNFPT